MHLSRRYHCAWAGLAVAILGSIISPARAEETSREVTILISSGVSGRLVGTDGGTLGQLTAAVEAAERAALATGREVVIVDAGFTLGPWALSQWDGGATVMQAFADRGWDVFTPGPIDLSVGAQQLATLASETGLPIVRPSVVAPSAGGGILGTEAAIDLGHGLIVRVRNALDPVFVADLSEAGFQAEMPAEPVEAPGSILLVVSHAHGLGRSLPSRTMTWDLVEHPGPAAIIFDPALGHDVSLQRRDEDRTVHLVGRRLQPPSPWTLTRLDLSLRLRDGQWVVANLETHFPDVGPDAPEDVQVAATIRAHFEAFQRAFAGPLPEGAPTTEEGLRIFVLEAMREAMGTEVALLTKSALRSVAERYFAGGRATREAVVRMLTLERRVTAVSLSGADIVATLTESLTAESDDNALVPAGLEYEVENEGTTDAKPTALHVNGRPLFEDDTYRVAVTTFLLSGGGDYEHLVGLELPSDQTTLDLRDEIVFPRLERATAPFVDWHKRSLWRYGADRIALFVDAVSTDSDPAYQDSTDSRAAAEDSLTFRADFLLRFDLDRTTWRWENRLVGVFGINETETETSETDDDLQLNTSVVFVTGELFRGRPYLGFNVNSEFRPNRNDDGEVQPRQLEETLSSGLDWSRRRWDRLRLGLVYRYYADLDRDDQLGLQVSARYLLPIKDKRLGFDGGLLAEYLEGGDSNTARFDLDLRLLVPLYGNLALTPAINYYLYEDSSFPGSATYYRLSLGLSWNWSGKRR